MFAERTIYLERPKLGKTASDIPPRISLFLNNLTIISHIAISNPQLVHLLWTRTVSETELIFLWLRELIRGIGHKISKPWGGSRTGRFTVTQGKLPPHIEAATGQADRSVRLHGELSECQRIPLRYPCTLLKCLLLLDLLHSNTSNFYTPLLGFGAARVVAPDHSFYPWTKWQHTQQRLCRNHLLQLYVVLSCSVQYGLDRLLTVLDCSNGSSNS